MFACTNKDTILAVDYHDEELVVRVLDCATGEENLVRVSTDQAAIGKLLRKYRIQAKNAGGKVIWVMESTTGWARVKKLLGKNDVFALANVLQMPLPPKAKRRKTDKIDTARILRETMYGELPLAYQPAPWLRRVRRLVSLRERLVSQRTATRNWLNRYLAHETWCERTGLWSAKAAEFWRRVVTEAESTDKLVLQSYLRQLEQIDAELKIVESGILDVYAQWPDAHRIDEIRGIAEISAVSILARIGDIRRFASSEELISYAGLAPGVRQSASTRLDGKIGGGGTDKRLRHYVMEATIWARDIPRYRPAYDRIKKQRGNKIARITIGRMILRSIHKMLRDDVRFSKMPA